jgi:hypothetical protein
MTDRTALYIDPTTLHVGIGTDRPSKPFHIQGDMMLSGQIYDGTGFPFSLGGGSWRALTSNQPSITLVSGSFAETCNVTLQRYSANDMALSVYVTGTILVKPSSSSHDYRFTLPTPVNPTSYPLSTTVGEFWLSATSNTRTVVFKSVAKTIPGINDRVALKYLSGTTEVSLAELNAGFSLSIQGMLAYQTDRYVQTTPTDAITIPGTNIRWIQATYPNPILVPPTGATITQTGRQGLLRYLGDDLVYNVLMEATINTQPTNKSLNYQISLEYPIQQSFYSSNAILGDLWLTVVNGSFVTTYKAYPQVSGGDASNVVVRYVNGTYDESLSDIDAPTFIRLQGNIVYKTTAVASVAIPTEYLPNRLYQDNDGNVAINNSGLPTRARFEVVETSNRPAILIDQRSGADIVQFRSNVNDIKAIINAKGNIGIGTSIAPLPITVKGNMQFDGIMYDGTGQPLWIPGSSVNWQSTPSAPVITVPTGGVWSIQTSSGLWRYVGNEINYNVSLRGTLTTQPTNTTQNFTLSLPYPVKLSAYPSNPPMILGELWADVAYLSSSNTFKAYAQVNPTDSNVVTLRVLSGTKDESLSTMLETSTLTLKGQLTYTTTTTPVTVPVSANYIPTNFTQDQSGQVALNSSNPPRGRLDIVTNSNLPALVVEQKGSGNIAEFIDINVKKIVIDGNGNVGIGTIYPSTPLDVNGIVSASTFSGIGQGVSTIILLTSGTSWTIPVNVYRIKVTLIGGGGGSAGCAIASASTNHIGGGGGGGAGVCIGFYNVVPGDTLTYTIGAGGTGGAAGANVGNPGGTTTTTYNTVTYTATGGGGGPTTSGSATAGTATGGSLNLTGQRGGEGSGNSAVTVFCPHGGATALGYGIGGPIYINAPGTDGVGYGGGASGPLNTSTTTTRAGGNGASGALIIEY